MDAREAHELVKQGKALLIDVREEQELRDTGTAEGALWMPLSAMLDDTDQWRAFKETLPRDKPLILFCKLGGRSGRMAELLCGDGYQAVNLGGFGAWTGAGLPVRPVGR
jgi:rhodanese-related sulfurtransferase